MNLDQEHECWFCGWDQGVADDYVSTWRVNLDEGIQSDDRIELCRFCYIGYAASAATSGLQNPPADPRDMALFANLLLAEIRKDRAPLAREEKPDDHD